MFIFRLANSFQASLVPPSSNEMAASSPTVVASLAHTATAAATRTRPVFPAENTASSIPSSSALSTRPTPTLKTLPARPFPPCLKPNPTLLPSQAVSKAPPRASLTFSRISAASLLRSRRPLSLLSRLSSAHLEHRFLLLEELLSER